MILSEKTKNIIDNCRFCWMCRHICPIGNATGLERNTARARACTLSIVNRGAAEMTPDIIDNMYECALCEACTKECATGFDPVKFVKEVRRELALDGRLPDYVMKMLGNFSEKGNIYGVEFDTDFYHTDDTADTLFFLGTDAKRYFPAEAVGLLNMAGVKYTMLKDEPDSGYSLDTLIGETNETAAVMQNAADVLNKFAKVIVYDPADAKTFMREYKELGITLTCKIVTFTSFIASLIKEGKITLKNTSMKVTYQDPAYLSRVIGETGDARYALSACAELKEMLLNGRDTMLAGNLIMNEYMPDVMKLVALARFDNARDIGVNCIVTASRAEYVIMNKVCPEDFNVLSFEQLLLEAIE